MKNIIIFTMGTRGDIQPYIYLAKELQHSNINITIGTHPCWRNLIEKEGVGFQPVGPDIDIENEAAIIRGKTKNPLFSMLRTMKFVFRIIKNSTAEILTACKNRDLIIVSHSNMGAVEAGYLGIPTVNVTLQVEMIPEKLKPAKLKDSLTGRIIAAQMARPYNSIRKIYALKKIKSVDGIMSPDLNLIPISKILQDGNPYWETQHKIVGYWYDDVEYEPDEKLKKFLGEGDKPIILSLGAMAFENESECEKLNCFINAFKRKNKRAVIQGFNKTLKDYELPDSMIAIGSVPHSWLFRQGYCVIHHCGFGTAAATLIAGIPSISVPHVLDQFGFAEKLYKIGASSKPIRASVISEELVASAIDEIDNTYDEKKEKLERIRETIIEEKGLSTSVQLITSVLEKHNKQE